MSERRASAAPVASPFSEMSVLRVLYDLYDSGTNETFDQTALGLGPIYARDNAWRPHRIAFGGGLICNLPLTVREAGIHLNHAVLQ